MYVPTVLPCGRSDRRPTEHGLRRPPRKLKPCPSIAYSVTILKGHAARERRRREEAGSRARAERERSEGLPNARGRFPQRLVPLELGDLVARPWLLFHRMGLPLL